MKVDEVVVLGSPFLIVRTVSVDLSNTELELEIDWFRNSSSHQMWLEDLITLTCGHEAKDITPSIASVEKRGVERGGAQQPSFS